MKPARLIAVAAGATFLVGAVVATVALARSAREESQPVSEALAGEGVVWHGNDLGAGERVILVVGGAFQTRKSAEEANSSITLGDLHGYYVASVDQFVGLREQLDAKDAEFVLVSAFRTDAGARDFMMLAEANDAPAALTPRLVNRGYEYVGLGQEQHPDGSGPLIGPLPGVST